MKSTLSALLLVAVLCASAFAADPMSRLDEEKLDQSGTVITIIFDDSGSMLQDNKMEQAKTAFREWLATVPDTYRIGLVALNGGMLVKWNRGNKSEVADAVAKIHANGATPLADTIENSVEQIAKREKQLPFERHVLVVFTDGEDSTERGADGVREELAKAAGKLVETVGIGFHGQGDYMSGAATRYFDAGSTAELRAGLQKVDAEIGDTSDIVIDSGTLAAMKTVDTANLRPEIPKATTSPTPTVAHQRRSSNSSGQFFVFIVAIFIVIAVLPQVFKAFK